MRAQTATVDGPSVETEPVSRRRDWDGLESWRGTLALSGRSTLAAVPLGETAA